MDDIIKMSKAISDGICFILDTEADKMDEELADEQHALTVNLLRKKLLEIQRGKYGR